jgi:hypothetical protein
MVRRGAQGARAERSVHQSSRSGRRTAEVVRRAVRETKLNDPAARKALLEGPAVGDRGIDDPMITLARRTEPILRELRSGTKRTLRCRNGERVEDRPGAFCGYGKSMPRTQTRSFVLSMVSSRAMREIRLLFRTRRPSTAYTIVR